jgi:hypothetical protein
MLRES